MVQNCTDGDSCFEAPALGAADATGDATDPILTLLQHYRAHQLHP